MSLLPSALFKRLRSLKDTKYTGKIELDMKNGSIKTWSFNVREKTESVEDEDEVREGSVSGLAIREGLS